MALGDSGLTAPSNQRSGIGKFFLGSPAYIEQIQRFTPEQQQAMNTILQQVLAQLSGDTFDFGPIEQRAREQFQQSTIPSLAERFTSLGRGAQSSSGFRQSLGQAGSGLESGLAALRSQYGLQRGALLQNLLRVGLQPQFEPLYHQRQPGFIESGLSSLAPALPNILGLL